MGSILRAKAVKLDAEDRRIAAKLQKQHKTTFSEIMRRALREFAKQQGEKAA